MLLAQNFKTGYQIIYPNDRSESVKYAAYELKRYLFQITGTAFPPYADSRHVENKEIVIGYTNRGGYTEEDVKELGEEGFIIKTEGEKIYIIGGPVRGALYGVYSFLEEYCGVRFYTRDFEKVPEKGELEIPEINDNKQIPTFSYRHSYWHSVLEPHIAAKLKLNGGHCRTSDTPDYLGGAEEYYGGFCHTIAYLNETNDHWHQPCYSDEDVYNRVLKNVRKILVDNPQANIVSITQVDGNEGACKCDKCRAINEAEGSESATNIMFVNRIAEELEEEYPNVLFDTFAYRFTRKPPKTIKPRPNVVVRVCTIECCNIHPIQECNGIPGVQVSSSDMVEDFKGWNNISSHMAVWNYNTDFANSSVMFPNWNRFLKDEKYFVDNNVVSVFEQGCAAYENGEFSELKGYIVARCLWDPFMSEEKYWSLIKEFVMDFYGAGGQHILDFIRLTLDCSFDSHTTCYFDNPTKYIYCRDGKDHLDGVRLFIERANKMFDEAENEADSGFALANVRRSRIQLFDYIDFYLRQVRESLESEEEKDKITKKIIENNTYRFNYIKMYDALTNREFNDLELVSEVDLSDYGLRW